MAEQPMITMAELEREIDHAKTRITLMELQIEDLKLQRDMLDGKPEAVHIGAQAALSAIHQMMEMKPRIAELEAELAEARRTPTQALLMQRIDELTIIWKRITKDDSRLPDIVHMMDRIVAENDLLEARYGIAQKTIQKLDARIAELVKGK